MGRMTSSRQRDKGKAPMVALKSQESEAEEAKRIDQLQFGLDKMEAYYVSFKEKRSITIEARFEIESFKDDFLDIYEQF
ncbi:hypothetical protein HAX54_030556 [Datura stramonium]|uniref:Uncharacterized protein n=1 Tax=Datura stramonium TaxID=4076 RepID=A0ABS8V7V5_DATST|nr:hypothetical protein [Datura stramonium]